jgi:hypothetical protein
MILTFKGAYGSTIDLDRDSEIQGYEFVEPPVEYRFLRAAPDLGLDFTSAWSYLPSPAGNCRSRCPDARSGRKESRNRNAGLAGSNVLKVSPIDQTAPSPQLKILSWIRSW